ncbi:hypothetical protein GCM10022206_23220 [Streptomyces chiangmaiensis]
MISLSDFVTGPLRPTADARKHQQTGRRGLLADKEAIRNTTGQTAFHLEFRWPSPWTQLTAHLDFATAAVSDRASRLEALLPRRPGSVPVGGGVKPI